MGTNLPTGFRSKMVMLLGVDEEDVKGAVRDLRREAGIPVRKTVYKVRELKSEDKKDHVWADRWNCYRKTPGVEANNMKKMAKKAKELPRGGLSLMYGTWTHAAISLAKNWSGKILRDNLDTARDIHETSAETHNYIGSKVNRSKALAKGRGWKRVLPGIINQIGPAEPEHFEDYVYEQAKRGGLVKVFFAMSGEWVGYKASAMRLTKQFPKLYITVMVREKRLGFKIITVHQGGIIEYVDE